MKTRGFTMIELLVVLSIVAVLAALVFAAMASSREGADAVECTGNLRTLATANNRYAAEHDGRFCPAQDKRNRIRWHGERASTGEKFDPARGPLAPYLGREARVKLCPSFHQFVTGEDSFENGSGGYGYNAIYIGGTPRNKWDGELTANIANPERTIMFTDTALSREGGVQEYPFAEPWQWVAPSGKLSGKLSPSVHFRHRGLANIAWCDGHVTAEKPGKLGGKNVYGGDDTKNQLGWIGPEEDNGWWNPRYEPPR